MSDNEVPDTPEVPSPTPSLSSDSPTTSQFLSMSTPPVLTTAAATITPKARVSARLVLLLIVVALLAGAAGGGIVKLIDNNDTTKISTTSKSSASPQIVSTSDIKSVLKAVEPGVVAINTNSVGVGRLGAGTGMIISAEGEVLTNAHVVEGGNSFTVNLYDSPKQIDADLVGINKDHDVALLKIRNTDNHKYQPVAFGDSNTAEVGDPVVAIGNALALSGTPSVTSGIVSATGRSIDTTEEKLTDLIQTDAAINFGNSGGPLVNFKSQVIGINTATADPSISSNIGFAISIDTIKGSVLDDLRQGKNTNNQALLGVTTYDVDAALKARFPDIKADSGAIIDVVSPNSPASDIGLQRLDIIVAVDGDAVKTSDDLVSLVRKHKPGDKVKIEWIRGSDHMDATATLVARTVGQSG